MKRNLLFVMLWLFAALLFPAPLVAAEIRVAVASNFADTMRSIAERFQARTGHIIILISGSTGKHYAQIVNGAPFDAFLAADSRRPERLERDGMVLPGNRFTYAIGKLALWSPRADYVDNEGNVLQDSEFRFLSIANPKLAPYGKAAQEVLQARSLWQALQGRLVRGENINQAFQFVRSGNAELGFVAYSQVKRPGEPINGSYWLVPQALYTRIKQQVVFLGDSEAAHALRSFMQSDEVLELIRDSGYDTP